MAREKEDKIKSYLQRNTTAQAISSKNHGVDKHIWKELRGGQTPSGKNYDNDRSHLQRTTSGAQT